MRRKPSTASRTIPPPRSMRRGPCSTTRRTPGRRGWPSRRACGRRDRHPRHSTLGGRPRPEGAGGAGGSRQGARRRRDAGRRGGARRARGQHHQQPDAGPGLPGRHRGGAGARRPGRAGPQRRRSGQGSHAAGAGAPAARPSRRGSRRLRRRTRGLRVRGRPDRRGPAAGEPGRRQRLPRALRRGGAGPGAGRALASADGQRLQVAVCAHNLGFVAGRRGDVPAALDWFDRAARGSRLWRPRRWEPWRSTGPRCSLARG